MLSNMPKRTLKHIKSKDRVRDQGEVFTAEREVNAMLGLVQHETERIESRFLEPACGDGNFLAPILERKLELVGKRYKKSQLEYERSALIAVGSIYGVEYLMDNVKACRKRLYDIFLMHYKMLFCKKVKSSICDSAKAIIQRNILWGDALSLKTPDEKAAHIVFSEWSRPFNDSRIKRHDYYFHELTPKDKRDLFSQDVVSDEGTEGFIPRPVKSYPLTHITKLGAL
jgi:hypothetical protein